MMEPPPEAPDEAVDAAMRVARDLLDGDDWQMASNPLPRHRMRHDEDASWAACLPFAGWLFPAFRDEDLACAIAVDEDFEAHPWNIDDPLAEALFLATGTASGMPEACRVRMVEIPGMQGALWIEGEHDTFVCLDGPRIVSGPEFAAMLAQTGMDGEDNVEAE